MNATVSWGTASDVPFWVIHILAFDSIFPGCWLASRLLSWYIIIISEFAGILIVELFENGLDFLIIYLFVSLLIVFLNIFYAIILRLVQLILIVNLTWFEKGCVITIDSLSSCYHRLHPHKIERCIFCEKWGYLMTKFDTVYLGIPNRPRNLPSVVRIVLKMNSSRLSKKLLLTEPKLGWKRSRGGQVMTWHWGMKESRKRLASVGSCCLPCRGPNDPQHAWLNTLEDMASNRCQ